MESHTVDDGDEGSADGGPDGKVLAAQVLQTNGGDHNDDKVGAPVPEDAHSGGLVSHTQRLNLSSVGPGDGQNAERKAVEVAVWPNTSLS